MLSHCRSDFSTGIITPVTKISPCSCRRADSWLSNTRQQDGRLQGKAVNLGPVFTRRAIRACRGTSRSRTICNSPIGFKKDMYEACDETYLVKRKHDAGANSE